MTYNLTGVLFEGKRVNEHTIYNPINIVKCNKTEFGTFDVENVGELATIFDYPEDNDIFVGFVIDNNSMVNKFGSYEEGISYFKHDIYPFLFIKVYDEIDDCYKVYKTNFEYEEVSKIANITDKDIIDSYNELNINDNTEYYETFNDIPKKATQKKAEQKTVSEKDNKSTINMKDLYYKTKESIVGQDDVLKKIVSTIDRNYSIENYRNKTNILLIGPSGSGKTEIFRTIASIINVPIVIEDSEQYSATGYVGSDVKDMLTDLIRNANGNINAAERGIIVIDEIDKKITGGKDDVSGIRVLNSILTMMEGAKYTVNLGTEADPIHKVFDTSYVTFVLAGAFSDLMHITKHIGINQELVETKKYKNVTINDLQKYGLSSETLRRLSIFRLNELTKTDFIDIMQISKNSVLKEYKKYAKTKNVKLVIDEEALNKIAEIAIKKNIGVSGIKDTFNELLDDAFFEVGTNLDTYSSIKISKESLDKKPPYILTKKKKRNN